MVDQETSPVIGDDVPASTSHSGDISSLQDTAISHCETLRRVVELEEWINGTRDIPMLASACRRWQEERTQLLAELQL